MEPKGLLKRKGEPAHDVEAPAPEPARKPGARSMTSRLGRGTEPDAIATPGKRAMTDAISKPLSPAEIQARIASERGAILAVGTAKYAALRTHIAAKDQAGKTMFAAARTRLRNVVQAQKLAVAREVGQTATHLQQDAAQRRDAISRVATEQRALVMATARAQALRVIAGGRAAGERVYAEQKRTEEAAAKDGKPADDVSQAGNTVRRKLQAEALALHGDLLAKAEAVASQIAKDERDLLASRDDRVSALIAGIADAGSQLEARFSEQLEPELAAVSAAESAFEAQLGRLRASAEKILALSMRAAGMVSSAGARNLDKLAGISARFGAALEQRIQALLGKVDAAIAAIDSGLAGAAAAVGRKCQGELATLQTQLAAVQAQSSDSSAKLVGDSKAQWRTRVETFGTEATSAADKAVESQNELATKISAQLNSAFAKEYESVARYGGGIWKGIQSFVVGLVICVAATVILTALLTLLFGALLAPFAAIMAAAIVLLAGAIWSIKGRLQSLVESWGDWSLSEKARGVAAALVAGLGDMLGLTGLLEAAVGFDVVTGAVLSDEDKAERVTMGVLSVGAVAVAKLGKRGTAAKPETGAKQEAKVSAGTDAAPVAEQPKKPVASSPKEAPSPATTKPEAQAKPQPSTKVEPPAKADAPVKPEAPVKAEAKAKPEAKPDPATKPTNDATPEHEAAPSEPPAAKESAKPTQSKEPRPTESDPRPAEPASTDKPKAKGTRNDQVPHEEADNWKLVEGKLGRPVTETSPAEWKKLGYVLYYEGDVPRLRRLDGDGKGFAKLTTNADGIVQKGARGSQRISNPRAFAKAMGEPPKEFTKPQKHHLNPDEVVRTHEYFKAEQKTSLAMGVEPYKLDTKGNGIWLTEVSAEAKAAGLPVHNGSHPTYSGIVAERLSYLYNRMLRAFGNDPTMIPLELLKSIAKDAEAFGRKTVQTWPRERLD